MVRAAHEATELSPIIIDHLGNWLKLFKKKTKPDRILCFPLLTLMKFHQL